MTTTKAETRRFQAETQQLLDLMIHSLYTHKEIFLRELVSNASDALDKLRFAAGTEPALLEAAGELRIRLEPDGKARTLVVDDNGIGMTREEVVENIGTIARSGTRRFLEDLAAARRAAGEGAASAPELIGRFGVGFYSSFMVAERVVLETRKAGSDAAVRWTSRGDGEYTLEDTEKATPGTRITLHLRAPDDEDESAQDFSDPLVLRSVVKRYSDFVGWPIEMDVERRHGDGEDGETITETEVLNSRTPLWTRPKGEIAKDEYDDFYRHLTHDWEDPVATIHFRGEGTSEYTALLYLPARRPPEIHDPTQRASRLSLYVRRVFVMQECEELLPPWLRFVRGLVDSADLPLNVSRETLQHNRQVHQIRKRLVKKVLESLGQLLGQDRARYESFWAQFGPILKEGLYVDDEHRAELAKLCLWQSTATGPTGTLATAAPEHGDDVESEAAQPAEAADAPPAPSAWTTLEDYVQRMPLGQKEIYYLVGHERSTVERSPHLEALAARGAEVLFLLDPVDEWVVQRLRTFDGRPLKAIDRGDIELGDEAAAAARDERASALAPLLEAAQESLDDYVKQVRLSPRLAKSPALLVSDEGALSPQMEAALRAAGQPLPVRKRILELNAAHPVVRRIEALHAAAQASDATDAQRRAAEQRFHMHLELLHGQALLAEGSPLPDPTRFARLVTDLMAASGDGDGAVGEEDQGAAG